MNNSKKRIEFVDLAKGVCILLIIMGHTGIEVGYPGISAMRTPLYLTISGLFFKDYGGLVNLIVRKTNKILIPFLFFYVSSYLLYYLFNAIAPGLIVSKANGILDVFTQIQYFNGPLWFLLVIFIDNILFGVISLRIRNELLRATIVLVLGAIGLSLYKSGIFLPCCIDASLVCLPFFYFGYTLKRTDILLPNSIDRYNIPIACALFAIAYVIDITMSPILYFHDRIITGNIFAVILLPLTSVMGLLMLCKAVGHLPFVSYFGRYSIIPLCTHHLIYRPIQLVVTQFIALDNGGKYIVAVVTILLCYAIIPLFVHYLPYFTAQKDIIKV